MKKRFPILIALLSLALVFPGCQKDETYDITTINMDKYMTLGEYKGLTVDYTPAEVSEEAVEEHRPCNRHS